jgi:release factor glutamine methyltransferase
MKRENSYSPLTIAAALHRAIVQLGAVSRSARLDAEILLASSLGFPREYLQTHADEALRPQVDDHFQRSLTRRLAGAPVAHLIGRKEFWSLDLEVSPAVLVPRPETELLVETALELLPADAAGNATLRVLDLGTGSGAIALALAHERPGARIVATDNSAAALAVAGRNAERLRLTNVSFVAGDWYEPVGATHFDLIVSNPPYIAAHDPALLAHDLVAEPRGALTPGPTGLEALEHIVARARAHLRTSGWLLVEHGAEQGPAVATMFSQHGLGTIRGLQDLAGHDRATCGRYQ